MTCKYFIIGFFFLFLVITNSKAQEKWSLKKCIDYALENNISIKRQQLSAELQKKDLSQSKKNRLPSLSAESTYGYNSGYTWLQSEAVNVDESFKYFSLAAGGSMPLFEGLNYSKTVKVNQINLSAALQETEKMKNDIVLQITGDYLQILFDKELLEVAQEQYKVTKLQADRSEKLVKAGSQAQGSYLEIKSQAAKEALAVTEQVNSLNMAILNLAQLLDLEDVVNFDIEIPEMQEVTDFKQDDPTLIYAGALGIMPEIKGAELTLQSSEKSVGVAKSTYYPSLSLEYSMSADASWFSESSGVINRALRDQLKSTRSTYVGVTLDIPIFNKLSTHTSVSKAKIGVLDAQYELQQQKLELRKEIQQSYADAKAAYNKYLSSKDAVESYKESFRYTEKKFNVGLVNSVDYNVAKTDFMKAQSEFIQSKYEYILRNEILDFYKGVPIEL